MGPYGGKFGVLMARQRFIHPDIWKDPTFGKLPEGEQVMFIGLFSIADDDGRTVADPAYLRSELFAYKDFTTKKVKSLRDSVAQKVESVCLYTVGTVDYIALLKWSEYQKPKYPKASKLPPPFPEGSPNLPPEDPDVPPGVPESGEMGRVGQGLGLGEGLDRAGQGLPDEETLEEPDVHPEPEERPAIDFQGKEHDVDKILSACKDVSEDSKGRLMALALRSTPASLAKVRESCQRKSKTIGVGYAINALQSEIDERVAAAELTKLEQADKQREAAAA